MPNQRNQIAKNFIIPLLFLISVGLCDRVDAGNFFPSLTFQCRKLISAISPAESYARGMDTMRRAATTTFTDDLHFGVSPESPTVLQEALQSGTNLLKYLHSHFPRLRRAGLYRSMSDLGLRDYRWAFFFAESYDVEAFTQRIISAARTVGFDFATILGELVRQYEESTPENSYRMHRMNRFLILQKPPQSRSIKLVVNEDGQILPSHPYVQSSPDRYLIEYSFVDGNLIQLKLKRPENGPGSPTEYAVSVHSAVIAANYGHVRDLAVLSWMNDSNNMLVVREELRQIESGDFRNFWSLVSKYQLVQNTSENHLSFAEIEQLKKKLKLDLQKRLERIEGDLDRRAKFLNDPGFSLSIRF